ncbi:MAG: hypothetical protein VCC04_14575 [Myxococcota bacterium]
MLARMVHRVKTPFCGALLCLMFALGTGAGPALGEGTSQAERTRWVPSFGILSAAFVQRVQGSVGTGDIYCPQPYVDGICVSTEGVMPGAPQNPIQPGKTERSRTFTPMLAATFQLMSPSFIDGLGAPRAFAHVDLGYTFGFERNIAVTGSPGPIVYPPCFPDTQPPQTFFCNPQAVYIQGQGATAVFEADSFQFAGGVGLAFSLEVLDRTVRIMPSVEYMREGLEFSGEVTRVIMSKKPVAERGEPGYPDAKYRNILLSAQKRKVYHSVGPGLEVEVDTRRAGPLMLSLFASARAYAVVGDLEVQFQDTNQYGEQAVWTFLPNRWLFSGNVGLRFRWVPE